MNLRLPRLLQGLDLHGLDGLLINHQPNIFYLTGYPSRESYLLVTQKKSFFITDFRYLEEAKSALKKIGIVKINGSLFKAITDICLQTKIRHLGFEAKNLNFAEYQKLKDHLARERIRLTPTFDFVEDLRKVKDAVELSCIKKAVDITVKTFAFLKKNLKPGVTQKKLASDLEYFMLKHQASKASFETIVASGQNSSLPHAVTCDKPISNNQPLLVDMGSIYRCYNSDLTRTFFLGKINSTFQQVYSIVKEAQDRAIKLIKPGVACLEVDRIARSFIAQKGYSQYFGHSLGHGVGLETHEEPRLNSKNESLLQEDMVVTIEPAIYLPGKFGVRIEDMVLVTKRGCEVLSGTLHK